MHMLFYIKYSSKLFYKYNLKLIYIYLKFNFQLKWTQLRDLNARYILYGIKVSYPKIKFKYMYNV